jgi:hypothetical protein
LVGIAVTILVNIVGTLAGEGLISEVLAGNVTDLIGAVGGLIVAVLPLITSLLIRPRVYSPATVEAVIVRDRLAHL